MIKVQIGIDDKEWADIKERICQVIMEEREDRQALERAIDRIKPLIEGLMVRAYRLERRSQQRYP
jgi:hypothetical protein